MNNEKIQGNIVDVVKEEIYPGIIYVKNNRITDIERVDKKFKTFILPGLVDAHLHIESSMLSPSRFAEAAVPHGTVGIVADPHEIANVLGMEGINFMRNEAKKVPLKIFFTAPSCVPATPFETSGAVINHIEIEKLMKWPDVVALGEVMNYPGVINGDKKIIEKIKIAKKYKKQIDGHCPGVTGRDLKKYIKAGITTDHECVSLKEAEEKASLGMKIMIREGSTAKNIKDLIGVAKNPKYECFLVSDDIHPGELAKGHVNLMLRKVVSLGVNPIRAIKMTTINPVKHYGLDIGLLQKNDKADIIEVNNLKDFKVLKVMIEGKVVAEKGKVLFGNVPAKIKSSFNIKSKTTDDFIVPSTSPSTVKVINIIEDQIVTKEGAAKLKNENGDLIADTKADVLKIAVCSRYGNNNIGLGFIKGFGIKKGAIASSIAHDSHNIIVIGTNNTEMAKAVNLVAKGGGLIAVYSDKITKVELPIAGLMGFMRVNEVEKKLEKIHQSYKKMGGKLKNPFMIMSFMALLVIPDLKVSDKGLFDGKKFQFTDIIVS